MNLPPTFRHSTTAAAAVALAALALGLAACGDGGGDSTTTAAQTTAPAPTETAPDAPGPSNGKAPKPKSQPASPASSVTVPLGDPADVPRVKGGDNSIADFGQEGSEAERAEAARVVATYFHAFAKGDGKTACALLASQAKQSMSQLAGGAPGQGAEPKDPCPSVIGQFSSRLPASARAQLEVKTLLSFRVDGSQGFAIWTAADGKNYHVSMISESGAWKVAAIGPIPSP